MAGQAESHDDLDCQLVGVDDKLDLQVSAVFVLDGTVRYPRAPSVCLLTDHVQGATLGRFGLTREGSCSGFWQCLDKQF